MAYLIVREPDRIAFSIPLKQVFRVGRSPENDLVLSDPHVSRHHVEFSLNDERCLVADLHSRHGTLVNSGRIDQCLLRNNDRIQIGKVVLTYCDEAELPQIVHQQPSTIETVGMPEDSGSRRLRLFYDLGRALGAIADIEALLREALQAIVEVLGCQRGLIGIKDGRTSGLRRIAWVRGDQSSGEGEVIVSSEFLDAILKRREAVITCGAAAPSSSAMAAPLQLGTRLLGFIYVEDRDRTDRFSHEDLQFFCALASLTAAVIDNAERFRQATDAAEALQQGTEDLIGESPPVRQLKAQISRYASAPSAHVLIRGESGTGKELVARTLHSLSPRSGHAFVAVNCAALPETMIESELFGYERGAFTGATKNKQGKFFLAHGGTLFLDEIGDLSLTAQAKVLRAIEDGEIQPLGSEKVLRADVRIISATNKNLMREVAEHHFREDLYYRLNALELQLEPLRARGDDVLLLARAFLERIGARMGKKFGGFTSGALELLRRYSWPGNIRELKNEIERAAILSEAFLIDETDLSSRLAAPMPSTPSRSGLSLAEQFARLDGTERGLVEGALARAQGNVSGAARLLGISRIMMKRRLNRYGLDDGQRQ